MNRQKYRAKRELRLRYVLQIQESLFIIKGEELTAMNRSFLLGFQALLCGRVVEMLGCNLQRTQKRSDPGIFIVLLQHLFGGAEESYRKPNPLAQI